MEEKLLNGLEDLGYNGPLLDRDQFAACVADGAKSIEYTKLVHWLTNEIRTLNNIDEEVNEISCPEDAVAFIMELTSFLKELTCPYTALTHGHVSDRLQTIEDRLLLLDYLVTELMGARILQEIKPDKKIELKLNETDEAAAMKKILMTLRFSAPPPNITVTKLFEKVTPAVQKTVQQVGPELLGTPIFCGTLSEKQWETLDGVERDLNNEYKIRREMLLTRLDVTIQSFEWSDKTKGKGDLIEKIYSGKRRILKAEPDVDISDLLAARDDIAIIEKTSSASVRKNTKSQLNKVIIGRVPDRGGRTNELAPPPPEMPSWQQRSSGPMGGGGFGGRGGGFGGRGGGNFQSNFNSGRQNFNQGGNYGGGNKSNNFGGFDSAGSYGSNRDSGNNFNRGSGGYSSDNKGRNFDSAGSYSSSYSRLANFDTSLSVSKGSYDRNYSSKSSYDDKSSYGSQDNSKSNYNSQRDYEQSNKRAKTYDSFQTSRTTYADQYVQESEQNKKFNSRDDTRSRSNRAYGRGGGHSYR